MAIQNGITFKLEGLDQIMNAFDKLPSITARKSLLNRVMKKSLEPVKNAAIQNAPNGKTNKLDDSIVISPKLKKSQRIRGQKKAFHMYCGSNSSIAHLVEWGTKDREFKEPKGVQINPGQFVTVEKTGRVRPNPFMRNAWDSTMSQVFSTMRDLMAADIIKTIKRLRRSKAKGTLKGDNATGYSSFLDDFKGFD